MDVTSARARTHNQVSNELIMGGEKESRRMGRGAAARDTRVETPVRMFIFV